MRFFDIANQYCKESTWKTIAALKFCLLSLGVIIGILLPMTWIIPVLWIFGAVFIVTYIPLMAKLFKLLKKNQNSR